MCDPTGGIATMAILTTATAAASSVLAFSGQGQKYNDNLTAANTNFVNSNNALMRQATEVDQAHSEDSLSAIIEGAKNAGRISASAGSLGASGSATAEMEAGAAFDTGRQLGITNLNTQNRQEQIGTDRQASFLERQTQINQVAKPSTASLVLGLADAGLKGASAYHNMGGKF